MSVEKKTRFRGRASWFLIEVYSDQFSQKDESVTERMY